jgi:glycerol-3-phosphate O-acyltransferase
MSEVSPHLEAGLDEPLWPAAEARRVILLLDASSRLEERLLRDWIARHAPEGARHEAIVLPPSRRRLRRAHLDPRLEASLAAGDDPLLAPLRVVWLAPLRDGQRAARVSDLLRLGDPRDPGTLRARRIHSRAPERCRIVAGEPAPTSELRARWREGSATGVGHVLGLAEFVALQAALALERAERRLRGARYKVPRFVHEALLSRPAFRGGLARLARELGRDETKVAREAARDLREIAATHHPFVIDLVTQLWGAMYSRGYGELRYDRRELESIAALGQRHPVVFLPTHKSNLDHAVLQYMLHENGLPPNHTAGGINMNFFPLGPLVRRSGVFFIRRTFKDDEIYKFVLQHYVDYLIEKRFPLEWYIEGGRSRSGKLLPPRFGLLAYVVDAWRRGKSEDVMLIPVSIAYDQISDVGDYAAEQRGGAKERESFGWFLRVLRRLGNQYGNIEIRFGEPVSLAKTLGTPEPGAEPNPDERNLALQKLAFEVCVRINRATPITPTSLVALALLGRGDRAQSLPELVDSLRNLVDLVARRRLPTTEDLDLGTPEGLSRVLEPLVANGLVKRFAEGPEPVYMIGEDQHLAAAYYRNSVIHFFVDGAIAELALLRAAEDDVVERRREFWDETLRLRDLLKFEFFFAEKETFRSEIQRELSLHVPGWEDELGRGPDAVVDVLTRIRPLSAHRTLRPFLEAYRVVGDTLESLAPETPFDEGSFLRACLALGRQYALQRRLRSHESISKVLFQTALRLARNRGLLEAGSPDLEARRRAFAEEIRSSVHRVDGVEALARARRAGLID